MYDSSVRSRDRLLRQIRPLQNSHCIALLPRLWYSIAVKTVVSETETRKIILQAPLLAGVYTL